MTNPILDNNIATDSVILWQYDKAYHLISLIQKWNEFAVASCTDFWNYFGNSIFPIDRADTYGLNVWGNMLGIPRPTINIPVGIDGRTDEVTIPQDKKTIKSSDQDAIDSAIRNGYEIYAVKDGNTYLYKPVTEVVDDKTIKYDVYGYSEDGYCVIPSDESDDSEESDPVGSDDSGWKTVTIKNTLYRGLLKARFFMMCHTPTVPNYNKYLSILFGAKGGDGDGEPDYDIFDEFGNVTEGHESRNKALDFQDMTMGFTFPENATPEEAYLIFQHYDVVYQFPAGIRYPGEFIDDSLVIGLNKTQEEGQFYKAFVDGLVLADDTSGAYPNGGIFSTTDRANYSSPKGISGVAYIYRAEEDDDSSSDDSSDGDSKISLTVRLRKGVSNGLVPVWIDWGNGDCGFHYIPGILGEKEISTSYKSSGLYSIIVLTNPVLVDGIETEFDIVNIYDLVLPSGGES